MRDVRHKRHVASSLDRAREIPLLLGAKAGAAAAMYTCVWIHVGVERIDVLVVNVLLRWLAIVFGVFGHDFDTTDSVTLSMPHF